ncbi:MAG: NAD(P)-binding protein [Acidobacteria bacterium]|nr:NAD(P)-binding protein [Acidobacteriota bacterium]
MRKIAIVGAGQAGLLTAHALRRHGYEVTVFSDKTPEDFLHKSRPTGTAARFDMSLEWERELGLNHWDDVAPKGEGIHLHFLPGRLNNVLLTLLGRFSRPFLAIDLRLQSYRWMVDLEKLGGKVTVEDVTLARLEEIAAAHDLTIVAAGRGPVTKLFPRDEGRSFYTKPPRFLAMVNVLGVPMHLDYCPFLPVKFNFYGQYGECFWVPWFHKDLKQAWSCIFEAKEGGPMDQFRGAKTGEQVLEIAKKVIREMVPWDAEWIKGAELADENSWLVGSFVPEVRKTVGTLPSGRVVMSLGDTNHTLDPVGGQGANNGNKMARNLVNCIVERKDLPFDTEWMTGTFEKFWERHRFIDKFNNTLLEPLTKPGQELLIAQYGSSGLLNDTQGCQAIANAFAENFNDPIHITEAFYDMSKARELIAKLTGRSWFWSAIRGRAGIAKAQIRQRLGLPSRHPGTRPVPPQHRFWSQETSARSPAIAGGK